MSGPQEGLVQADPEYAMSYRVWEPVYSYFLHKAYDPGLRARMINGASWKTLINSPKVHCMEKITT